MAKLVLICSLLAVPAQATQGEHAVSIGGTYARTDSHGAGARIAYGYGLTDFWNVSAQAGYAWLSAGEVPVGQLIDLGAGVLYHIDAFTWIPWFELELLGLVDMHEGLDPEYAFGLGVGGGVDYRPSRVWGVGLFFSWKGPVVGPEEGDVHPRVETGIRFNFYIQ